MVQTNPAGQHPPLPLPLLVFADADTMQHLLTLQAMPWCGGFYLMPFDAGPQVVHQGVPAATEQQNQSQYYQEAPSSAGPRRNQRKRFRKAEPSQNNQSHESPGTMAEDRSTGVDTGHAWIAPITRMMQEWARYGEPRQRTH